MAVLGQAEKSVIRLLKQPFSQVSTIIYTIIILFHLVSFFLQQIKQLHISSALAASDGVAQEKSPRIKTVQVYRWNPETPEIKPKLQEYKVDLNS